MGLKLLRKIWSCASTGDIEGTRQSGILNFKLANIVNDRAMVDVAKNLCEKILTDDPDLSKPENIRMSDYLKTHKGKTVWSKIS